jgi:hypothetical protein
MRETGLPADDNLTVRPLGIAHHNPFASPDVSGADNGRGPPTQQTHTCVLSSIGTIITGKVYPCFWCVNVNSMRFCQMSLSPISIDPYPTIQTSHQSLRVVQALSGLSITPPVNGDDFEDVTVFLPGSSNVRSAPPLGGSFGIACSSISEIRTRSWQT